MIHNSPKLRPLLSAINTATNGSAKFSVSLLSFEFVNCITNQKLNCFMISLLWTDFLLTFLFYFDDLFKYEMTVSCFNKKKMFEMFSLTLKESIILFDNKYLSEIDAVAMGSPLGPTLANILLYYH